MAPRLRLYLWQRLTLCSAIVVPETIRTWIFTGEDLTRQIGARDRRQRVFCDVAPAAKGLDRGRQNSPADPTPEGNKTNSRGFCDLGCERKRPARFWHPTRHGGSLGRKCPSYTAKNLSCDFLRFSYDFFRRLRCHVPTN
jgi:hypothetical protein